MSWVGSPTAVRISSMVTSPALGMLAAPTLARVAVRLGGVDGEGVSPWGQGLAPPKGVPVWCGGLWP